ncbi:nucleotidyltransferase family protein [Candidatus Litorirhabdus singularis]|uniref:nucleotidyltransferase family protein n=1 Tax=Candidatus Litorirhabdus singularis TaxID=2518993 RepID=UPI002431942C|nr:nucleotidyltransferase family protein [Candidatus Litorirhabdus singularis]
MIAASQNLFPSATAFRDLCHLLSPDLRRPATIEGTRRLDWGAIAALSQKYNVDPALGHMLEQGPLRHAVPGSTLQTLEAALRDNVVRNLSIKAAAIKISRALNDAAITPVFFKGTAGLLTQLHPSTGFRRQLDIDLMVAPDQEFEALGVLQAQGYQFCESVNTDNGIELRGTSNPDLQRALLHQFRHHHHYPPLTCTGQGFSLELHRHPLPRRWQHRLTRQLIASLLEQHDSHGARFTVPTPELAIVIAILGKFASDGGRSRYHFPLPQALDCRAQLNAGGAALDVTLIESLCGSHYRLFQQLLDQLMAPEAQLSQPDSATRRFLYMMDLKHRRPSLAALIDRVGYRHQQMRNLLRDPGKLLRPRV